MAAPTDIPAHHVKGEICPTRPSYREGRNPKAVKVYTVNQESRYLLVQGVPAVGATQELVKLFAVHGAVEEYHPLDEYPTENKFEDVYLIKFSKIHAARIAKKKLDDWSFFGGVLHVCYAPEFETVEETKFKLQDRRKTVAFRIRKNAGTNSKSFSDHSSTTITSNKIDANDKKEQNETHQRSLTNKDSHQKQHMPQNDRNPSPQDHNVLYPQYQGYQNEEPQYWIPAPPKENPHVWNQPPNQRDLAGYNFARVPTAHSVFPTNYDARLNNSQVSCQSNEAEHPQKDFPIIKDSDSRNNQNSRDSKTNWKPKKDLQTKGNNSQKIFSKGNNSVNTSDTDCIDVPKKKDTSGDTIIVKDYKSKSKAEAPRFVPRQTMNLIKKQEEEVNSSSHVDKDVNRELKKNTFTLGKEQGPVVGKGTAIIEKTKLPEEEKSVEISRSLIRKRISAFASEISAKKMKEGKS